MATQQRAAGRRSALVLDIARLGRRPGAMLAVHQRVPSPTRIGLELVAIEAGTPIDLDLTLQSVSEGVLVTGTASAATSAECARCLTGVAGHVEIDLTELYAYPDSLTEATTDDDEVPRVGAGGVPDTIDLEQQIVDAVGLALPFAPLCGDDCPGLCPQCGAVLAADPGHHHDRIDPRWAKLAGLLDDGAAGPGSAGG